MSRQAKASFIVTANELLSGDVVFRNSNGGWSPGIDAAAVFDGQVAADEALAAAQADEAANIVMGAYTVAVTRQGGAVRPSHIRERIRALGPTVRGDLARSARGFATTQIVD